MLPQWLTSPLLLSIAVLVLEQTKRVVAEIDTPFVHYAARAASDDWTLVGPASDSDTIHFQIYLKARNEAGLDDKMMEIVESQGRLPWLTFEELKSFVEPTRVVRQTIRKTLTEGGAEKIKFGKLGNTLALRIKVGRASELLHAQFNRFTREDLDGTVIRTFNYTLPAAIQPFVLGLTPLLDFSMNQSGARKRSLATRGLSGSTPRGATSGWVDIRDNLDEEADELILREAPVQKQTVFPLCHRTAKPVCLRQVYGINEFLGKPDDPSLALVLFGPEGTNVADLDAFMKKYRPGVGYDLKLTFGTGLKNEPPPAGAFAELSLDIQTASGIASPIPLRGYVLPASDETEIAFTSFFDYFTELPDAERPGVASYSFGTEEMVEATSSLRLGCQSAKHLTALGTTIFVASGDWGVFGTIKGGKPGATCPPFLPTWPSGCPYVVSVGATADFAPERAVDVIDHDFWGGGGFSNVFPTPSYQQDVVSAYIDSLNGAEDGNFNASGRGYPDLSAIGYRVPTFHAGRLGVQVGTSASSPSAAAVFALLNSARKAAGLHRVGWANPTMYKDPAAFVDVTKGKAAGCTDQEGVEHSLPTRPGWDASTGYGTLRFDKLREVFGVPA